jgi:hypothetical protein
MLTWLRVLTGDATTLRMASTQTTSQPTAVRTTKLASTVSTSSSILIDRFTDILEVAAPNNKDKYITAAETYQIDVHASAMVSAEIRVDPDLYRFAQPRTY